MAGAVLAPCGYWSLDQYPSPWMEEACQVYGRGMPFDTLLEEPLKENVSRLSKLSEGDTLEDFRPMSPPPVDLLQARCPQGLPPPLATTLPSEALPTIVRRARPLEGQHYSEERYKKAVKRYQIWRTRAIPACAPVRYTNRRNHAIQRPRHRGKFLPAAE